jgi:hypothetical protein
LGEGNSKGQVLFKGEIISKLQKIGWGSFKNIFQNHWANFNQTSLKLALEGEGMQISLNEGDCPSTRGGNSKRVKIH